MELVEAASQADRVLWSTGQPSAEGAGAGGAGEVKGHISSSGRGSGSQSPKLAKSFRIGPSSTTTTKMEQ